MTKFETSPVPEFDEVKKTIDHLKNLKKGGFDTTNFVDATVGLADTGQPEWQKEAGDRTVADGKEKNPSYEFEIVEKFKGVVEKYLFGREGHKIDSNKFAILATHGGTDSVSKIVSILERPIVPVGMPNWPNTQGLIEAQGGVVVPYSDFEREKGDFNHKNAIEVIKELPELLDTMNAQEVQFFLQSQRAAFKNVTNLNFDKNKEFGEKWLKAKMVTPLLHAVGKNPTGFDVPKKVGDFPVWQTMADELLEKDMILIVDAAYLAFGKGPEKDNAMIKYFVERGVKMMIAFSGSKLFNMYGKKRIGAIVAVNFDEKDDSQRKVLHKIRTTTGGASIDAQNFAVTVESYSDLNQAHKKWLKERRENAKANREIIADYLKDPQLSRIITESRGLFVTLGLDFAAMVFPELAEKMGLHVPENAKDFPSHLKRVAGIITPDSGIGNGNLRLNTMQMTQVEAGKIGETLRYAEEKINNGIELKQAS